MGRSTYRNGIKTMKPTFTVIIQSNIVGGGKVAFKISDAKAYKLFNLLEPEAKRQRAKEDCSSIKLDQFFTETN